MFERQHLSAIILDSVLCSWCANLPVFIFIQIQLILVSGSSKRLFFFMFVFHDIHVMLSILFPGDLLRKLGKFVTTLHSSNSSSDYFHTVLNIPFLLSLQHPLAHFSRGWPFTSGQFWDMNLFLISSFLLFSPYVPSLLIASFLPFLLVTLALFSRDFPNAIMIFWDDGIGLISKWLPCSPCFLRSVS